MGHKTALDTSSRTDRLKIRSRTQRYCERKSELALLRFNISRIPLSPRRRDASYAFDKESRKLRELSQLKAEICEIAGGLRSKLHRLRSKVGRQSSGLHRLSWELYRLSAELYRLSPNPNRFSLGLNRSRFELDRFSSGLY